MYTITIMKSTNQDKLTKEYEKLREPYKDEDMKDTKNDPQYGYVETEKTVNKTETIFEQSIEDIDLKAIINAINN